MKIEGAQCEPVEAGFVLTEDKIVPLIMAALVIVGGVGAGLYSSMRSKVKKRA